MTISAQEIKNLRERTGAGIGDVKKALEESGGDHAKALEWLERKLGGMAAKKSSRETSAGLIDAYIHSNGRVGVLLELYCETDFVARNPAFKVLAHDLSLHIAAMNPLYVSLDAVPKEVWSAEESRVKEEVHAPGGIAGGKSADIAIQIVEGKLKAHFGGLVLLTQPFVKDQDKTVGEFLNEAIGRFGENIKIGRFVRLEI